MAQSVEHIVHIDGVVGSSPTGTTITSLQGLVFCYMRLIVRSAGYEPGRAVLPSLP